MSLALALSSSLATSIVGIPSWVPAGAVYYGDFQNGNYWDNGSVVTADQFISTACTSTRYHRNAAGVYSAFGANTNAITNLGLLIEDAATNKCENFNANPTDTTNIEDDGILTVADDTAALAAAGLSAIATSGIVYYANNTSGVTKFFNVTGEVGNTNPHTLKVVARGTGTLRIRLSGQEEQDQNLASGYQQFTDFQTPGATIRRLEVRIPDGAEIYFLLTELIESAAEDTGSPIVVAGSSATRAAATFTKPASGSIDWTASYIDDSTQDFNGVSGNLVRAGSALNGTVIKTLVGYAA